MFKIKEGDILLFSGKGIVSNIIKLASFSRWSHIGVMVKYNNELKILESTTLFENKTGKRVKGVQLVYPEYRLSTYKGKIARLSYTGRPIDRERSDHFIRVMDTTPYEKNRIELSKAALDLFHFKNKRDISSVFCSELVAEYLQYVMQFDLKMVSNEYTPGDFEKRKEFKKIYGDLRRINNGVKL